MSVKNFWRFVSATFILVIIISGVFVVIKNSNKLSAPTISFDKSTNILRWDSVRNSDYYIVKVSGMDYGAVEVKTTNTSLDCSGYITRDRSRDYQFQVKAVSYNSKYQESDWSRGIYYSLFVSRAQWNYVLPKIIDEVYLKVI